jgi:hypothetical protein
MAAPISEEVKQQIIADRPSMTLQALSDKYHVAKSSVDRIVANGGASRPPAGHARHLHTQAERDARTLKVVNLRSQGYSMTEIAKMIGVNISTAHYYAAKATKGASSNGTHARIKAATAEGHEAPQYEGHIGYLFGKIESLIEHYADSSGVPRAVVASGVLQLFRRKARW